MPDRIRKFPPKGSGVSAFFTQTHLRQKAACNETSMQLAETSWSQGQTNVCRCKLRAVARDCRVSGASEG